MMLSDKRIGGLVTEEFALITEVRGCLNIKNDDIEGLIKQALKEERKAIANYIRKQAYTNIEQYKPTAFIELARQLEGKE